MTIQKTAILIFANSAREEAKNKPFTKNSTLFEKLNEQIVQKVKRCNIPYFIFSEEKQSGNTFGERYTHAIQFVFDQGFENIITVGNDTPHLKTAQLIDAAQKLNENSMVLGPSSDGGFYLLGLKKTQFNKQGFLKLPWQTSGLTQHISQLYKQQNIPVFFLKRLADIDTVADIKLILDCFGKNLGSIKKILLTIFSFKRTVFLSTPSCFQITPLDTHLNKGSPISFQISL